MAHVAGTFATSQSSAGRRTARGPTPPDSSGGAASGVTHIGERPNAPIDERNARTPPILGLRIELREIRAARTSHVSGRVRAPRQPAARPGVGGRRRRSVSLNAAVIHRIEGARYYLTNVYSCVSKTVHDRLRSPVKSRIAGLSSAQVRIAKRTDETVRRSL